MTLALSENEISALRQSGALATARQEIEVERIARRRGRLDEADKLDAAANRAALLHDDQISNAETARDHARAELQSTERALASAHAAKHDGVTIPSDKAARLRGENRIEPCPAIDAFQERLRRLVDEHRRAVASWTPWQPANESERQRALSEMRERDARGRRIGLAHESADKLREAALSDGELDAVLQRITDGIDAPEESHGTPLIGAIADGVARFVEEVKR